MQISACIWGAASGGGEILWPQGFVADLIGESLNGTRVHHYFMQSLQHWWIVGIIIISVLKDEETDSERWSTLVKVTQQRPETKQVLLQNKVVYCWPEKFLDIFRVFNNDSDPKCSNEEPSKSTFPTMK